MYEYIFVYIDFFVGNIFYIFFFMYVHLSILDKGVSTLYASFGTPVC
jgi:hypothetical protein